MPTFRLQTRTCTTTHPTTINTSVDRNDITDFSGSFSQCNHHLVFFESLNPVFFQSVRVLLNRNSLSVSAAPAPRHTQSPVRFQPQKHHSFWQRVYRSISTPSIDQSSRDSCELVSHTSKTRTSSDHQNASRPSHHLNLRSYAAAKKRLRQRHPATTSFDSQIITIISQFKY